MFHKCIKIGYSNHDLAKYPIKLKISPLLQKTNRFIKMYQYYKMLHDATFSSNDIILLAYKKCFNLDYNESSRKKQVLS